MAKLTLTDIASGYKAKETLNENNAAIEAAIENTLSRDGSSPNQMESQLDMNSNRVINLPVAVSNSEPITLGQFMSYSGLDYDTVATNNVYLKETAVATANQTIFNLSMSYTPGANTLLVYVNGAQQILSLDYNETNSTRVTFTQGLIAGDNVVFHLWQSATVTGSAPPYYARTAAEVVAGATPVNYQYPELHLYRYGTNTTPGTTDMTSAITTAINVAGQYSSLGGTTITLPSGIIAYNGVITLLSFTSLIGNGGSYGGTKLIPLSASARLQPILGCQLKNLWIYDGSTRAGGIGITIGSPTAFRNYITLENVKVEGFETNIFFDNSYFIELKNCEVKGGTYGITVQPTSGSSLGYVTTISFDKVYIHNCTNYGYKDASPLISTNNRWTNVVVEQCASGLTTVAQVDFGSNRATSWDGGYIESTTTVGTKPIAIKAKNGYFANLSIDGCEIAFDLDDSSTFVTVENCTISTVNTYNTQCLAGSNGRLRFRNVNFSDNKPHDLSLDDVIYDQCNGYFPTNVNKVLTATGPNNNIKFQIDQNRQAVAIGSHTGAATNSALYVQNNAATDLGILAKNINTDGISCFTAVNDGGTRYLTMGLVNSTSSFGASYGSANEAIIRASSATSALVFSCVNDNIKWLATTSGTLRMDLTSTGLTVYTGHVRTVPVTVSALPTASGKAGARHFVTDANATTFASIVAGGGSNGVPVYSDGTNWRIG